MSKNIKAFISYAWEDDPHHKTWIEGFATRLRSNGIEATYDQWEVVPGDQLTHFMERSIVNNDYVLIICTPKYKIKSDSREGGVGYEGDIITSEINIEKNHRKFIAIIKSGDRTTSVPVWLQGKLDIDLREDTGDKEYEKLLNTLTGKRNIPPVAPNNHINRMRISQLLKENKRIYEKFGPKSKLAENLGSNTYKLWEKQKKESIIPNNSEIVGILSESYDLLTEEERISFDDFKSHAEAFAFNQEERLEEYPLFPQSFAELFTNE